MARLVNARLVVLAAMLLASAQLLAADPTRPPAAWLNPDDVSASEPGGLRLQSVLMRRDGKSVAVISGQAVAVGAHVGEARLISVNERQAVLRGPDGVTRLYLTPGVEKRMIVTPGNKAGTSAQGKESR